MSIFFQTIKAKTPVGNVEPVDKGIPLRCGAVAFPIRCDLAKKGPLLSGDCPLPSGVSIIKAHKCGLSVQVKIISVPSCMAPCCWCYWEHRATQAERPLPGGNRMGDPWRLCFLGVQDI